MPRYTSRMQCCRHFPVRFWCLVALTIGTSTAHAAPALHEGVASCASTTCHGAARPLAGTRVLQNEYVVWSEFDPHAGAFRILRGERSQAIARRLGIGAADQAPACLACHSEVVAAQARGARFQPDDGIGCEACHGAAEKWLAGHDDGTPTAHLDSVQGGLLQLDDPVVRAPLCAACHVGSGDRLATHAMLAAGHPRLSFELDTFTELWRTSGGREHYRRDADSAARKVFASPAQVWLTGLVEGSGAAAAQVVTAAGGGALPEFAAFNCYSCHRDMGLSRWRDRQPGSGTPPGALRINDSALRILATALTGWLPDQAAGLRHATDRLERAANSDRAAVPGAVAKVRTELAGINQRLRAQPPQAADQQGMLMALLRAANSGAYPDYATAEQVAMAVVVLLADNGAGDRRRREVDSLFAALEDDAAFDQARFARILSRFAATKRSPN